jgi:hypothetical protein
MDRRHRDSLLWGVVGAMAFLVLVQGYELLTDAGVAALVKLGVAVVVLVVTAVSAHVVRPRLARNERS